MMIAAYTVCSANDLARAKTFMESLAEHEPAIRLFICLTDRIDNRFTHAEFAPATLIEAEELGLPELEHMSAQYSITELNCAMKSFFGHHILQTQSPKKLLYFDTDIFIYQPLTHILEQLDKHSILLTPHIQSPIPQDGKVPRERTLLAAGLYNGGFIGFANDKTVEDFFQWWRGRMKDQAFILPAEGMFYDQNWLNFVPLYFKNVAIITHAGHNVAYWNLHEKKITKGANGYEVNALPLIFFHFSGLDPHSDQISKHQDRFVQHESVILDEIFTAYKKRLKNNRFTEFSQLACAFGKKPKQHSKVKKAVMNAVRSTGYEIKKLPR